MADKINTNMPVGHNAGRQSNNINETSPIVGGGNAENQQHFEQTTTALALQANGEQKMPNAGIKKRLCKDVTVDSIKLMLPEKAAETICSMSTDKAADVFDDIIKASNRKGVDVFYAMIENCPSQVQRFREMALQRKIGPIYMIFDRIRSYKLVELLTKMSTDKAADVLNAFVDISLQYDSTTSLYRNRLGKICHYMKLESILEIFKQKRKNY